MKKNIIVSLFLLLTIVAKAQQTEGTILYERATNWGKMYALMPYLSQEEKDRELLTSKNWEGYKQKMKLTFSPTGSLYTYENKDEAGESGFAWRKEDYLIYRHFAAGTKTELIETLGKTYIVEDSLRKPKWKIGNQIKEIAGHVCMKAETQDPDRQQKITAWFAQDILVPAGPERYVGLPGVILELDINDGVVVIEAVKIEFKPVDKELALPAKLKGKRIKDADYDAMIRKHVIESIKNQRNPFWSIRY